MDQSAAQAAKAPLDPDPASWLTAERLQQLEADLLAARSTLAVAGLLPRAVDLWLRQQLAAEAPWSSEDCQQAIAAREPEWRAKADPEALGLLESEVATKLAVAPGCQSWAEARWGHRLETLFLQRKHQLDRASCRLLRVADKGLALELYHRIKAGEESFAALSRRYGEGPERAQGGLIPLQPLAAMPLGLGKVLPRLEPGELLPPTRLGEQVAIVQLELFKPARFDAASRQQLLAAELDQWLRATGALALAHLRCPHRIEAVIP
ncbi:peptidylprolyl isomerase [Cyanobium sp. ATX 6E8]|uniref:peptidylprolyl isomerase n=1 Tax=Cyanobium sp. ATX 6E8 TaxID=2823701 RepID=UPI0020CE6F7C|nr:peptidylprolyl isomerase [Cyanobium sp. ATX 6E8]MCP9941953.1 peptidylprolyl isomerase [Cyanobium sp. ATX 6E8]